MIKSNETQYHENATQVEAMRYDGVVKWPKHWVPGDGYTRNMVHMEKGKFYTYTKKRNWYSLFSYIEEVNEVPESLVNEQKHKVVVFYKSGRQHSWIGTFKQCDNYMKYVDKIWNPTAKDDSKEKSEG